jgi:glycosyltransferase involved in cell wall biosynthesis
VSRLEYEWIPDPAAGGPTDAPLGRGSITACLVVRNEETTIDRCLRSIAGVVDEIVLVHDGECDDRTIEIASTFGCRVFVAPRWGHCEHHIPFAYEQAQGEWVLTIDADEFLSAPLRGELRALARSSAADGYEFLWRLWDGRRYTTTGGPYKLALVRRRAIRIVGIIHSKGQVEGAITRLPLQLEHQPLYDNFSIARIGTKWRRWARIQAREYLSDLNELPRFNYPGRLRWSRRRSWANRLAPILIVPAAVHTCFYVVAHLRKEIGLRQATRFAATQALYRAMVTAYVARLSYREDRERRRSTELPRPVRH